MPTGGLAALDVQRSAATERQVNLKLFGFGFGSGRSVAVEVNEGIAERSSCMRVLQHVVLRVRRFEANGSELITTDVVRCGAREFVAWPDCPHCRADAEPDPFDFDLQTDEADALDLRGYDEQVRREQTVRLEGVRKTEVGLDLPLPTGGNATAGLPARAADERRLHGRLHVPARAPVPALPAARRHRGAAVLARELSGTARERDRAGRGGRQQRAAGRRALLAPLARGRAAQARE